MSKEKGKYLIEGEKGKWEVVIGFRGPCTSIL